MKILLLCNQSPFPPREGAPIAMNAVATGLMQLQHEVTILSFVSNKNMLDNDAIPLPFKDRFYAVPINLKIGFLHFISGFFSKKSQKIQRFFNYEYREKLIELLTKETFDIVQLETIYVASYIDTIQKYSTAKIVLRAHNVEHLIWERMFDLSKNPIKQMYFSSISKKIKRFEIEILNKVQAIVTMTEYDFDRFRMLGFTGSMLTLPFGIDVGKIHYSSFGSPEMPSFCHIGEIGRQTNMDGIRWFLNNVWNLIHIQYPCAKFYIAGRNIPYWMEKKYKKRDDVVIVGEVPSATEFIRSKCVLIVPILLGSGIRIKIIEGMACFRPVLTTSIGAEGIACENKKNIAIANTPAQFFDTIENFIKYPEMAKTMGSEAQKLIREKYNNKDLIKKLVAFYENVIRRD